MQTFATVSVKRCMRWSRNWTIMHTRERNTRQSCLIPDANSVTLSWSHTQHNTVHLRSSCLCKSQHCFWRNDIPCIATGLDHHIVIKMWKTHFLQKKYHGIIFSKTGFLDILQTHILHRMVTVSIFCPFLAPSI